MWDFQFTDFKVTEIPGPKKRELGGHTVLRLNSEIYLKQMVWYWLARCCPFTKLKVLIDPFVPATAPVMYCKQPVGASLCESQGIWLTWKIFLLHVKSQ